MSHSKEYTAYINSNEWKARRTRKLDETPECRQCRATTNLVVHHKNYKNFKHEAMGDLVVLCMDCHNLLHKSKPKDKTVEEHTNKFLSFRVRGQRKEKDKKISKKASKINAIKKNQNRVTQISTVRAAELIELGNKVFDRMAQKRGFIQPL